MTTNLLLLLPPLSTLTLCATRFNTLWKQSSDQGPQLTKSQTAYATSGQSWPAKHIQPAKAMITATSTPADAAILPSNNYSNAIFIYFPFRRLFNSPDNTSCKHSRPRFPYEKQQQQKHLAIKISAHVGFVFCLQKARHDQKWPTAAHTHNQRLRSVFVCVRPCTDREWCKEQKITREEREREQHTMTRTVE